MEKQHIVVELAHDGQEAVELFQRSDHRAYDAILMDMRMPRMDGIEATRCIRNLDREDAKTVPIIAMTANAFEEDRRETKAAGMNAHLSKPIELDQLYYTLSELIQ